MYVEIAILAGFAGLYAVFAGGIERTPINGAFVFVGFGMMVGPLGFGIFGADLEAEGLKLIAELSLALVLFADASKANFRVLERARALPIRLIFVALPMVIGLGLLAGWVLIDGVSLIGLALLATMLAPTDAALGKPVVSNPAVPENLREGLSFESGLNDGVCVPIFLALLAIALSSQNGEGFGTLLLELIVDEIGIGAAVGLGVSFVGAHILWISHDRGWISEAWLGVPAAAIAICAFTTAQALHGSGFIAAFVGGLLFGYLARRYAHELVEPAEAAGDVMMMLTWIAFGAGMLWQVAHVVTWQIVLYAVVSLSVVRMVPVWLVLRGLGLPAGQIAFVGWFGPRGLATVVFAMIIAGEAVPSADIIIATASVTILLSVVAHGISALPVIRMMFPRGA